MAEVDLYRRLATRCAVLCATADHLPKHLEAATQVYQNILAEVRTDGVSHAERALLDAFKTATGLGLQNHFVRDHLWAAVKLFGECRRASWPDTAPEAKRSYWWQDH